MSVAVLTLFIVYLSVAAVLLLTLFVRSSSTSTKPATSVVEQFEQDIRVRRAREAFSVERNDSDERNSGSTVWRRREIQRGLLGPLVTVDCNTVQSFCLREENCRLFCKDAAVVPFDCVDGVCVERLVGPSSTSAHSEQSPCDTKNGEFGLLVGYNELGVAQWECVQLYPGWENRARYCENGVVSLDTRIREPSYADCQCPIGTQRMVYERSVLGNVIYGLPHCVPENLVEFYKLSYRLV